VYLTALDLIVETPSLDFTDALCAAHMERLGLSEIYTFDRDFDRINGVERVAPGGLHDA
jgi:predicted nucleic acid-binding protein